ncbi:hypothetical protein P4C99_04695 [Pontiellaceae bacterium B1224]|nr:hypothetical protein [Pontiellaceae bacterium B1224]
MKIHLITLVVVVLTFPVWAQQTNELNQSKTDKKERSNKQRREWSAEEKAAMDERRLQILEKTLKEIGVTEEQKVKIIDIQKNLKEQMRTSYQNIEAKKKNLSELEKSGATEEKIYAAIDEVSDAQAEQMKILARNRMQMEKILGKEKYKLFMDSARNKWKEHGRRGGSGMPQKPELPPLPDKHSKEPPVPASIPPTP